MLATFRSFVTKGVSKIRHFSSSRTLLITALLVLLVLPTAVGLSLFPNNKPSKLTTAPATSAQTAKPVRTTAVTAATDTATVSVDTPDVTSQPAPTTSASQPAATPIKTTPDLYKPAQGPPTTPTIKLSFTNSGAHMIYFYAYAIVTNAYKFIIHPVQTATPASDSIDIYPYLQINTTAPASAPSQTGYGNPNLSNYTLSNGDKFDVSLCDYTSGSCATVSNTLHITMVARNDPGATTYDYIYSQ